MLSQIKMILRSILLKRKFRKKNTVVCSMYLAKDIKLGKYCNISKRVIVNENVEIGDFTYLNSSKYWTTIESNVVIGKFCSIAPNVHIGAGNHDYSLVTTHPILFDPYYEKLLSIPPNIQQSNGLKDKDFVTKIGNDVWIGYGAIIKRGIQIGNGAIIAGGAVVTKDVPAYAIVGGNPAKIIKYRTDTENILCMESNLEKMWWNWSIPEIINNMDKLYDFKDYVSLLQKTK